MLPDCAFVNCVATLAAVAVVVSVDAAVFPPPEVLPPVISVSWPRSKFVVKLLSRATITAFT